MAEGNGAFVGRYSRIVEELGMEPWTEERAALNNLAMDRALAAWDAQDRFYEEQERQRDQVDGGAYAQKSLQDELAILAGTPAGGRNTQVNTSAFNLGQLVGGGLLDKSVVETALAALAKAIGCDDDDLRAIKNGLEAGIKKPRTAPEKNGKAHKAADEPRKRPKIKPGQSVVLRASDVTPREVEWLWPGRIPLGKLTTFAGVGGLGKTFVLCDITARVTRGLPWPDSGAECCTAGRVLFVSGEDDPDDTLVPRMIELGADLDRVFFLRSEVADKFTLEDLDTLDAAMEQSGGDVRFVAIDPPTAYLGDVNDHKNAELRGLLGPLKSWASRHRVALIFNTHVTKPQGVKVDAMMRVMGSVAWVNAVRAAHMFTRDPDDFDRRLFIPMKNNLGPERKGLAYRLAFEPGKMAKVEWLGEVDTTADDAVNRQERQSRQIQGVEFLRQMFAERREIPSDEIWAAKKGSGLSDNALKEAKAKLKIRAAKRCVPGGNQMWVWIWPDEQLPVPTEDIPADTAAI